MMIDEFKEFQGENARSITQEEYNLVEFVYTYHPLCLDKQATANLYNEFGIIIFLDMLPRSRQLQNLRLRLELQDSR